MDYIYYKSWAKISWELSNEYEVMLSPSHSCQEDLNLDKKLLYPKEDLLLYPLRALSQAELR